MREGGAAVIVTHNAVFGVSRRPVRSWSVSTHEDTATIMFMEPRKRTRLGVTARPRRPLFYTVEVDGQTVYDSRDDVPIDMTEWRETAQRFGKQGAGGIIHHD